LQHQRKLIVEFSRHISDTLGVVVLLLISPDVFHRAQGGQQGRRTDQNDMPIVSVIEQTRLVLQGQHEGGFNRDKDKDEIKAANVQQFLVIFLAQIIDVI